MSDGGCGVPLPFLYKPPMQINLLPEYTEELSLYHLKPEAYLLAAGKALQKTSWHLVSAMDNVIVCRTDRNSSYGEVITIKVEVASVVFTSRSLNEYYWTENQNKINAAIFKQAVSAVIARDREREKKQNPLAREQYGAFIPSKTYLVTPVLLYINVLVFLVMFLTGMSPVSPAASDLLAWGGNFRPAVMHGDWWRMITHMFLHGGILHLLMNMYALVYIGMMLEPLLGKLRFAAAYIITGVCGGLLSLVMHPYSVGVGASGAIFGMYGVFLALLTTKHIEKTARNTMLRSILFFVVFNLIAGLQGNVDNAAHIGGLLSGLAIGYIYFPGIARHSGTLRQVFTTSFIALIVLVASAFTIPRLPDDYPKYEQKMQRFSEIENKAIEVFKQVPTVQKDAVLNSIANQGIKYWTEELAIVTDMQQLDLPTAIQTRNRKLAEYCHLRLDLLHFMTTQTTDNDTTIPDKIKQYQALIAKVLDELDAH